MSQPKRIADEIRGGLKELARVIESGKSVVDHFRCHRVTRNDDGTYKHVRLRNKPQK